ncbi:PKD domain-containing protein, partial [Nonlabens sp.]|uniref:PKD domain-containing protein n=1 Tax=Nonlabens sp. TaxID=1888209 RepID=UPI0039E2DF9E
MKRILTLLFLFTVFLSVAQSQINMPLGDNGGNGFRFIGCNASAFNDSQGSQNYGNGENNLSVFCPAIGTDRMELNFLLVDVLVNDVLTIYDGDSTAAPVLGTITNTNVAAGLFRASTANATGCLSVRFVSNGSGVASGWRALRGCFDPCQSISTVITTTPSIDADGILRICQGETVTFNGSANFSVDGTGATYEWDLVNGGGLNPGQTQTGTYNTTGIYQTRFIVTDASGCTDRDQIDLVVQVSSDPDFTGTQAADTSICFGESTVLTGVVTPQEFAITPSPPITGQTFLPDGNGVSYQTCVDVDLFPIGSAVTQASDIIDIFLNMEHSYLGDLQVTVVSPNGSSIDLHVYPGGTGTFLGIPIEPDTNITPGTGFDYVFTEAATQTWIQVAAGNATIPAGDYLPVDPFSNFIGSPLNGQWCITITDNLGSDNGYIFFWGLNFNPAIIPAELSFTPGIASQMWQINPDITAVSGNNVTVLPSSEGLNCYVYEFVDSFGCTYTEQVCVNAEREILALAPIDIISCNTAGTVDLTQNDTAILNGLDPAVYTIAFHVNLIDAQAGINSIVNPATYTPVSNPQIVFASIEDTSNSCILVELGGFSVEIVDFTQFMLPDLDNCGFLVNFDLDAYVNANLSGSGGGSGSSGYTITFHPTQADAEGGTNLIASPYDQSTGIQTIYIRIESTSDSGCYTILPFDITVFDAPVANMPADMNQCDDLSNDGLDIFILSNQDVEVLNGQTALITYHLTTADALNAAAPLNAAGYQNISNPQTVYVRIENLNDATCFNTTTFDLVVNRSVDFIAATDMIVCDDLSNDGFDQFDLTTQNAAVLGTQIAADNTITFYNSLADANAGINAIGTPAAYTNTTTGMETVFVRIENNTATDCYDTGDFDLIINATPTANPVVDVVVCDDLSNDGIDVFVFDNYTAQVLLAQDPLSFTVSYHDSQADADSGSTPLDTTAYTNTSSPQTIYVRIENGNDVNCATTTTFDLVVNRRAAFIAATDMIVCDDLGNDGFDQFDLTTQNAAVLGTQIAAENTITFYNSLADANAGINAIATPAAYTNTITGMETVFVRIENNTATDCYDTGDFDLIINATPTANPVVDVVVCDDLSNDGIDVFVFDNYTAQVLLAQDPLSFTVSYHDSQADADSGSTPLDTTAYTNTSSPQTIYVRIENGNDVNCATTTTFDLVVNRRAAFIAATDMIVCDDLGNDGFDQFDLTTQNAAVLGTQIAAENTITFYNSLADANAGINAIATPAAYTNTITGMETVFVRIENNTATDCYDTGDFDLIINATPTANPVVDAVVCDDLSNDGIDVFVFDNYTAQVFLAQDPLLFTVSYHDSQADADSGSAPLDTTAYTNTSSPQTIYVRIENGNDVNCATTTTFDLVVNRRAAFIAATDMIVCDDLGNDGFDQFDLTTQNAAVLGTQIAADNTITFYNSLADANAGINAIATPAAYTNTTTGMETVFVRIENNTATDCYDTGDFDLIINATPT